MFKGHNTATIILNNLEDFKYKNAYNPLTSSTISNSTAGGQFGKQKLNFNM
jgi:hypothetical protein